MAQPNHSVEPATTTSHRLDASDWRSPTDYLMVVNSFWPARIYGGPIYSTLNLCRGLSALGREVRVITSDANRGAPLGVPLNCPVEPFPGIQSIYYRVNRWGTDLNLLSPAMIGGLWQGVGRARVVLAQGLYNLSTPLAALFGRLRNRTVVVSPRGALAEEILRLRRTRLKRLWLGLLMRPLARRVVWHATSPQEEEEILRIFPGARVMVVPNGLDLDAYRELPADAGNAMRRRFGLGAESGPVVVSLGRIHPKKALDVLIQAFEALLQDAPHAELLIAGPDEGGELERLRHLVAARGLGERVHFPGHLAGEEKTLFLAGADLFVLPSQNENFGLVYAEALAAGTPIVASRKTPWERVESVGCGRWVPNTVEATAAAMRELLNDDPVAAGARGRSWILKEFDYRAVSAEFDATLRAVPDPSAPSAPSAPPSSSGG